MISGVVDYLANNVLAGWVKGPEGGGVKVHITVGGISFRIPADIVRNPDRPSTVQFGYRFCLPGQFNAAHLFDGTIKVEAELGDTVVALEIWRPLKTAAILDGIDAADLQRAIRFIKPEHHVLLQKSLVPSWVRPRLGERRPVCILTYAHDSGGWFPYFYNHYKAIAGADAIFIVSPNAQSFSSFAVGGIINLAGMPYDNTARAALMSSLCGGLQAYFSWTLLCDVDEIVLPHPAQGRNFFDTLSQCKGPVSISRGFEIIQADGEGDFDISRSVLDQRHLGIANSAYCKPHLAQAPVDYANGYHYCNHRPVFEPPGKGFVTFHLKWACRKIRGDVSKIISRINYTEEETARNSRTLTPDSIHPKLRDSALPVLPFNQDHFMAFEQRYVAELRYVASRDHWFIGFFCANAIYDLGLLSKNDARG